MNHANYVYYIVIGLYAFLMVRVGFYVLRFNHGEAEYFRGASRIPWLVAGLSCSMSGFSAWTLTGAVGVAYRFGVAAIALYFGNALSFLLAMLSLPGCGDGVESLGKRRRFVALCPLYSGPSREKGTRVYLGDSGPRGGYASLHRR